MYSVLDIARYIILKEREEGHFVSNLKLQKILYFIQAEFLVVRGEACFFEDIIASEFGPIVLEVYHEYKVFGGASIPFNLKISMPYIRSEDKKLIDDMLDMVRRYSASTLTKISINQMPWTDTYSRRKGGVISRKLIREYFDD